MGFFKNIFQSKNHKRDAEFLNEESIQDYSGLFSYEYKENKQVGQLLPALELGTPTLAWHVGVWQKRIWDPSHAIITSEDMEAVLDPKEDLFNIFKKVFGEYKENREIQFQKTGVGSREYSRNTVRIRNFKNSDGGQTRSRTWKSDKHIVEDEGLNKLLDNLQQKGRVSHNKSAVSEQVNLKRHIKLEMLTTEDDYDTVYYDIIDRNNICFTLWWLDDDQEGFEADAPPPPDAIRVRVHVQIYPDFFTISFFIDVNKPWNEKAYKHGQSIVGDRRKRIYEHVRKVNEISRKQYGSNDDESLVPEGSKVTKQTASDLLEARTFLYSHIWHEFRKSFGFTLDDIVTKRGECFVNMRGVVLNSWDKTDSKQATDGESSPYFEAEQKLSESNADALLRSYWPFIRRITPFADVKDHVACGLMGWKAVLVTSLGSILTPRLGEEWHSDPAKRKDIPSGFLPEETDFQDVDTSLNEKDHQEARERKQPIRFLILSQDEPNRMQLGRMLDRINTLETFRLFALKDWSILKNSDTLIRMRGQEIDAVMGWWTSSIAKVHEQYNAEIQEARRKNNWLVVLEATISRGQSNYFKKRFKEIYEDSITDKRDTQLTEINHHAENYLVSIGASIDSIGKAVVGGVQYRVNRSKFYINRFNILVQMLNIGQMDKWVGYDQFVDRGLKPEFEFINQIGERLEGLRGRLEAITQSIQTSAIVVQASATGKNTRELKRIAWWFQYGVGSLAVFLYVLFRLIEISLD